MSHLQDPATKDHGRDERLQRRSAVVVVSVACFEGRQLAEVARQDEVHDGPEVSHTILDRRAGDRERHISVKLLDRLCAPSVRIADVLGLVENYGVPANHPEQREGRGLRSRTM